jgi:hypothetical protein
MFNRLAPATTSSSTPGLEVVRFRVRVRVGVSFRVRVRVSYG